MGVGTTQSHQHNVQAPTPCRNGKPLLPKCSVSAPFSSTFFSSGSTKVTPHGGGVSFQPCSPTASPVSTLLSISPASTRIALSSQMVSSIRHTFESTYGFSLHRDLLATSSNSLLPFHGLPLLTNDHATFVLDDFHHLDSTLFVLRRLSIVAVVVTPTWPNFLWFTYLVENSTHRMFLPLGATSPQVPNNISSIPPLATSSDQSSSSSSLLNCFFLDTRFEKRCVEKLILLPFPLSAPSPWPVLPPYSRDFL
jgi:hypothetical protein